MGNKILFDYVGQSKENKLSGTIPRAGGGDGLAGTSRGLFQPLVPLGFVRQVRSGALCANYKPGLNIIGGAFFFQRAP